MKAEMICLGIPGLCIFILSVLFLSNVCMCDVDPPLPFHAWQFSILKSQTSNLYTVFIDFGYLRLDTSISQSFIKTQSLAKFTVIAVY